MSELASGPTRERDSSDRRPDPRVPRFVRVDSAAAAPALRGAAHLQAPATTGGSAHPFVQLKFPDVRRDKFQEGVILGKDDFAQRACARRSSLAEADSNAAESIDAPFSLRVAIDTRVQARARHQSGS